MKTIALTALLSLIFGAIGWQLRGLKDSLDRLAEKFQKSAEQRQKERK